MITPDHVGVMLNTAVATTSNRKQMRELQNALGDCGAQQNADTLPAAAWHATKQPLLPLLLQVLLLVLLQVLLQLLLLMPPPPVLLL